MLKTALNPFILYQNYITNARELPYFNAKLGATKSLSQASTAMHLVTRTLTISKTDFLTLNIAKEKTTSLLSHVAISPSTTVDNEPKLIKQYLSIAKIQKGESVSFSLLLIFNSQLKKFVLIC